MAYIFRPADEDRTSAASVCPGTFPRRISTRTFSAVANSKVGNRIVLDEWVPYRSDSATARLRVIGFPHAAGNALFYRSWRTYMPLDIDFCPIELPGHGQRIGEMAVTHLDTLVPTLQAVLEPLLTIPFAFFGHSTGACIAFEAARVLRAIDGRSATQRPAVRSDIARSIRCPTRTSWPRWSGTAARPPS